MRPKFGCLGLLAAVYLAIAAITMVAMLIFAREASWGERLIASAALPAIIVFAILLLAWRDKTNFRWTKRKVNRQLMQRSKVSEVDFCKPFPQQDPQLLLEIRKAIAAFFAVPPSQINPVDDLNDEFAWHDLSPTILISVTYRILAAYQVPVPSNRVIAFPKSERLGGFAEEIQQLMSWMHEVQREKPTE
jgi:hypothetical protein